VARPFTWLAGAVGGLAAYRAARRRREAAAQPLAASGDPAQELRAKLAEARAEESEPEGPDARRRSVHEEARSALDEMRGDET
jgi:hypothetical protein